MKESNDIITTDDVIETVDEETNTSKKKPIVAKDIDDNQYVTVRNGFQGTLVYKSKRTGETFKWDEYGDEQEVELRELRNAKSSAKKFFENNWFMFKDSWIVDYLGIGRYYRHAIDIEDFDKIFTMTPAKIKKTIAELSEGQKKSVAYRANVLIHDRKIDSLSVINALEESLGVELIEK